MHTATLALAQELHPRRIRVLTSRIQLHLIGEGPKVEDKETAHLFARAYMEGHLSMCVENFVVLLLDARGRCFRVEHVARGTMTACIIHPREVFLMAVREMAVSIIVCHNHPSGDPSPSSEDESLTRRLHAAGETLGIPVLDHIVLGANNTYRCIGVDGTVE